MEIIGKIIQILDKQTGKSARGEWSKQDFVIETKDEYPKKVCISSWNNKVDLDNFSKGSDVKVYINIESREYNGKWYTDVKAWKMEAASADSQEGSSSTPPPMEQGLGSISVDDIPPEEDTDDLPF